MTKKNFFLMLLLMVTVSVGFVACGPDDEDPFLEVNTIKFETPASGITESFKIESNTAWSITGFPSWVTVTPTTGSNSAIVSVNIAENTTTKERTARLNVISSDGNLNQKIEIEQEGAAVELSTDLSVVTLGAEAYSRQDLNIYTNTNWNLSGMPEWLNVSAISGNGTSSITLTAITTNESASERSAILTLRAEEKYVNIEVKQRGALAAVTVVPTDIVALYDELCFEMAATGSISYYYYAVISENEINRMTDKQIINLLESQEPNVYNDGYIMFPSNLSNNTTYYICTIAYNTKEERGELIKTRTQTGEFMDRDNDAYATIACYYDEEAYDLGFAFEKQAHCAKYHAIMGYYLSEDDIRTTRSLYAFQINYYLKHGKKHWFAENRDLEIQLNYPNDHIFRYVVMPLEPYPYVLAYSWGIFEDGTLSSDVMSFIGNLAESNNAQSRITEFTQDNKLERNYITLDEVREQARRVRR